MNDLLEFKNELKTKRDLQEIECLKKGLKIPDSQELRIGNLLYCWNPINDTYDDTVIKVNWKHIRNRIEQPDDITYHTIPLTEEWLIKLGFMEHDAAFDKDEWCFYIEKHGGNWCLLMLRDNFYIKTIEYVHQLQNLYYALTGEELEINL